MTDAAPVFEIHSDINRARTLPARFYLDPEVFTAVREKVFVRSWQWAGDLSDVAAPGSAAPRFLCPGLLDEPVLLVRDAGGTLRCLSNVCTHRGHLIVDAPCQHDQLRCPYHGRRFDLAGRFVAAPGFDGAQGFPTARDHLAQLAFGSAFGLGFASLAPALPIDDWLGPVRKRMDQVAIDWDALRHDPTRDHDYTFDAHWALYVDNYLEGLHIPFVHGGLMETIDWKAYRYQLFGHGNLQLAPARDGELAFDAGEDTARIAAYYWWLFPNLMLNFYPWGLSLNIVQPLGAARTRVSFRSYVARPDLLGQGAGGALDRVEWEDEAAVQAVQRGIQSRLYDSGRYAPTHERGVHQFHRLLAAALGAT